MDNSSNLHVSASQVIEGNTEEIAQKININFIQPVAAHFCSVDPAIAKEFCLFMIGECIANLGSVCVDQEESEVEFMRLADIVKAAIDSTADDIKANRTVH